MLRILANLKFLASKLVVSDVLVHITYSMLSKKKISRG